MQSLQDQVEEAERRHSAVEGQVSCVSMFHCTLANAGTLFSFSNNPSAFRVYDNVSEHINKSNPFNFKRKQPLQFSL